MTEKLPTKSELRARLEKVCDELRSAGIDADIRYSVGRRSMQITCSSWHDFAPDIHIPEKGARVLVLWMDNYGAAMLDMSKGELDDVGLVLYNHCRRTAWLDLETGIGHNWKPEWTPAWAKGFMADRGVVEC